LISIFLDRVASYILSRHARDLPDLRGAILFVPPFLLGFPEPLFFSSINRMIGEEAFHRLMKG